MRNRTACLAVLALALPLGGGMAHAAGADRPFIYGCGMIWGRWLGLPDARAKAFDDLEMDRIKQMGGTNVPANFAWIDIEPKEGVYHWDYVDHQVEDARKRGLTVFAYTGLTPDWALPPNAPKTPGIGYRFPPGKKYIPQFEAFFRKLAARYRGRVKYYEFWNEENGCGWINDGCANGQMAPTYVPWLKRWYKAMKSGDPDCVLAVGGLDYNAGVKDGWKYLDDIYKAGGGQYFDAVAIHPYGDPLHWQAIADTYACMVRHGDAHKKLWLNEYGWNTSDEADKAKKLKTVLTELAKPKYHMVFMASYLSLVDLPNTKDRTGGHDYGLCSRDRRKGTITPRASYLAFQALPKPKAAPVEKPAPARRGKVPAGFLLYFDAPGCDPGQQGDDMGPPWSVRNRVMDATGANVGEFGISWAQTERHDPGQGPDVYDFSKVRPAARELGKPHLIVDLNFMGNPWAARFRFKDRPRYNRLLARWAAAACKFAREKYGASLFEAEGNERDLVAPSTYRPYFRDWHYFYMEPIKALHEGMKRANSRNRLIIGNLCYSDREHIGALYAAGARGNFEVLAIHAYGPQAAHVDMEQIIESHEEMAAHGDADIPILVTEGWSSLPLPDSLDKDPAWRHGGRPYTPQEIEHFRQAVLDGWRNLTTPRPGMYDPAWVCGARFFVLNDFWGGRGWAARAKAVHDAAGKLTGFNLDGYFIKTSDPDYIKPFLRPWGLIDIKGRPKGDTIKAFPPYLPRQTMDASLAAHLPSAQYWPHQPGWTAPEVVAGRKYIAHVTLANHERSPMTQLHFLAGERTPDEFAGGYPFVYDGGYLSLNLNPASRREVSAKVVGSKPPTRLDPGQKVELTYEVTFAPSLDRKNDRGVRKRVRPIIDVFYIWQGRPYHLDAWLPRVCVRKGK